MHFISVIVRYLNEPYIQEFIDYYFSEGIDHIYLLYDIKSTIPLPISIREHPKITVKDAKEIKSVPRENLWKEANLLYQEVRNQSEWFMYVDCDEFISTYTKLKKYTIRTFLSMYLNHEINCVMVPWVMMSSNYSQKDPPSILQHNVHRWSHDVEHKKGENGWMGHLCIYQKNKIKCIFKSEIFDSFNDHCPNPAPKACCVNALNGKKHKIPSSCISGMRENNMKNAYLLCFHYRIISLESAQRKMLDNGFDKYRDSLQNILQNDYPEKKEFFLRKKSLDRFGPKKYR